MPSNQKISVANSHSWVQKQTPPIKKAPATKNKRQRAKTQAPANQVAAPPHDKQWRDHEHTTPATERQTEKLTDRNGSSKAARRVAKAREEK